MTLLLSIIQSPMRVSMRVLDHDEKQELLSSANYEPADVMNATDAFF